MLFVEPLTGDFKLEHGSWCNPRHSVHQVCDGVCDSCWRIVDCANF